MLDRTTNKKKILFAALVFAFAALVFGITSAETSDAATYSDASGTWTYEVNGTDATITKFTYVSATDIIVPENIDTYTVVAIGDEAFKNVTEITSVTFCESIVSMGTFVFQGCSNLTTATLNENITAIPDGTFYKCTKFAAPLGITEIKSIGDYAFAETRSVTGWDFSLVNITSIGLKAFYNCEKIEKITLKENSVVKSQAFVGCPLKEVQFPGSITVVSDAFDCTFYDADGTTALTLDQAKGYYFVKSAEKMIRSSYLVSLDTNVTATVGTTPVVSGSTIVKKTDVITLTFATGYELKEASNVTDLGNSQYSANGSGDVMFTSKAIVYNVTYYKDAEVVGNGTYTVAGTYRLITPASIVGYTFNGWFDNSSLTGEPVTVIPAGTTGDKEYYAKWTINTHTVTYMLGNDQYGDIESYEYNVPVTVRAKASVTGYTVSDWNRTDFVMPDQDVIISASKTPIKYTVTLKADGEHITGFSYSLNGVDKIEYTAPFQADYDSTVTVYLNTEYGYRLDKWSDGSTSNPMSFVVNGDASFSATATNGVNKNLTEFDQYFLYVLIGIVAFMGVALLLLRRWM